MADELKESGTVTAMSVVGFVFGLIGMLGSFIPCIGSLAFYISIPSSIVSGIALLIANNQKAKKTFAIVALTVGLIGTVISGIQYFEIISAGEAAENELQKMLGENVSSKKGFLDSIFKNNSDPKFTIEEFLNINSLSMWGVRADKSDPPHTCSYIDDVFYRDNTLLAGDISPNGWVKAALTREYKSGIENRCLIIESRRQKPIIVNLGDELYSHAYLEITPDSKKILIITPSAISFYEASTGKLIKELTIETTVLPPKTTAPPFFNISASGKKLLISDRNVVDIVSLETGEKLKSIISQRNIHATCINKEENTVALASVGHIGYSNVIGIQLFNYETGNRLKQFIIKTGNIDKPSICFSKDNDYLYLSECENSRSLCIVDIEDGAELTSWTHSLKPGKVKMDSNGSPFFTYYDANLTKEATVEYDNRDYIFLSILDAKLSTPEKREIETSKEYSNRVKSYSKKLINLQKESMRHFKNKSIFGEIIMKIGEYSADENEFDLIYSNKRFKLKANKEMAKIIIASRNRQRSWGGGYNFFADVIIKEQKRIMFKNITLVTGEGIFEDIKIVENI